MLPRLSRRSFNRILGSGLASLAAKTATASPLIKKTDSSDHHFFLTVVISGGADASYLFDARPLAFTDSGIISNYLYRNSDPTIPVLPNPEPILWQGNNAGSTLVTPLVNPLEPFRDQFSILNGVHMLNNGQVGHGANMYYLFTGKDTSGGDSFAPILGQRNHRPLENVRFGGFEGNANRPPSNFGSSIALTGSVSDKLREDLLSVPPITLENPSERFLQSRYSALGSGSGLFSKGVSDLAKGLEKAPDLENSLTQNPAILANIDNLTSKLEIVGNYLKSGVTDSITLVLDHDFVDQFDLDSHGASRAKKQLLTYQNLVAEITTVFRWLTETIFDPRAGTTFMDVCTTCFASEFSRTMRQTSNPIDNTGTDHNPYTNTVLLAGKGIKTGAIYGASDLDRINNQGQLINISNAHRQKDEALLSIVGKPFDVATGTIKNELPETFDARDYLNFTSVINTLLDLRELPENEHFALGPGFSEKAPVLNFIMKD